MLRTLMLFCCVVVVAGSTADAQVIISLDSAGNTSINLGAAGPTKVLDFYISTTPGSGGAALTGAVPNYNFAAGIAANPLGRKSPTGSSDSGSGFFGDGNLNVSELRRDSATAFGINQEFEAVQSLTVTPQLWFSVDLDTTGLQDDSYNITMSDPNQSFLLFDGMAISFFSANNDLSFAVNSAIPEPSSMALLAFASIATGLRRRRTVFTAKLNKIIGR